jgi:hypothetical protein
LNTCEISQKQNGFGRRPLVWSEPLRRRSRRRRRRRRRRRSRGEQEEVVLFSGR